MKEIFAKMNSNVFFVLLALFLVFGGTESAVRIEKRNVNQDCKIVSQRCDFSTSKSCTASRLNPADFVCKFSPDFEEENNTKDYDYGGGVSPTNTPEKENCEYCDDDEEDDVDLPLGICNSDCFEDDGAPADFTGQEATSVFCKVKSSACVFPFKETADGPEHNLCVRGRGDDTNLIWCATAVDENGVMVKGFWGQCDMDTCGTSDDGPADAQTAEAPSGKVAEVKLMSATTDPIALSTLTLEDPDPETTVTISGSIAGLENVEAGPLGIRVYEENLEHCYLYNSTEILPLLEFGDFNLDDVGRAEISNLEADGIRLISETGNDDGGGSEVSNSEYDDVQPTSGDAGDSTSFGKTLVIYSKNSDEPVACGVIAEPSGLNLTMIIIVALSLVVILLLILIVCLCCCCCRKRNSKGKKKPSDETDLPPYGNGVGDHPNGHPNGYGGKSPLYDELSIPFIDASPAPTPKAGRSTERLSFFQRNSSVGRSRGSLASSNENL